MRIVFENLACEHQDAVIDILNYYIEETTAAYREHAVGAEHFANFLDPEDNYCAFAVKDERNHIAGFATLERFSPLSTFAEVAEVMYFLHPDDTGKGIGTLVLQRLEEEAKRRGIRKILANLSSENDGSLRFHQRHGFTECGRLHNVGKKFGRYFSMVWMEKELD